MHDTKRYFLTELFKRHQRELLTYLSRRAGRENAPDLLQETFLRALRHDELAAVANPPAFLQSIAINLTRDFTRRRATEARHFELGDLPNEVASSAPTPEDQVEGSQRTRLLADAVESLPPRCREVFVLVMHEDVPLSEAARRLGISESMARRHLRLALQRCRAALD